MMIFPCIYMYMYVRMQCMYIYIYICNISRVWCGVYVVVSHDVLDVFRESSCPIRTLLLRP